MGDIAVFKNREIVIVVLITLVSVFFRAIRLGDFQYWSDDEQLFWYVTRHIAVDGHLSLTQPNTATGAGLGTIFHMFAAAWSYVWSMNPTRIALLGNVFNIVNVLALYLAGKSVGGKRIGYIAAFLYAISFTSSLFDRRLWALTPSVALVSLAIYALSKTLDGEKKYFTLAAIPIGFAFNSDPSLGVMLLAVPLFVVLFRVRLSKQTIASSFVILLVLLSPLIMFDIRHQGQNIKSITSFAVNQLEAPDLERTRSGNFLYMQLENFSRFLFPTQTSSADSYFCYCFLDDNPVLPAIASAIILFLFIGQSFADNDKRKQLLLIIFASYLIGIYGFREILEGNPAFFYSLVISPVIFMVTASVISKSKWLLIVMLSAITFTNIYSFSTSSFKYPLTKQISLTQEILANIPDGKNYSLYHYGDIMLANGGWASLFDHAGNAPVRGNLSLYWGHTYETYSLYPKKFMLDDPEIVVILSENNNEEFAEHSIAKGQVGGVAYSIFDNKEDWFNQKAHTEELYQPRYFE